jgi:hypothetical protein
MICAFGRSVVRLAPMGFWALKSAAMLWKHFFLDVTGITVKPTSTHRGKLHATMCRLDHSYREVYNIQFPIDEDSFSSDNNSFNTRNN